MAEPKTPKRRGIEPRERIETTAREAPVVAPYDAADAADAAVDADDLAVERLVGSVRAVEDEGAVAASRLDDQLSPDVAEAAREINRFYGRDAEAPLTAEIVKDYGIRQSLDLGPKDAIPSASELEGWERSQETGKGSNESPPSQFETFVDSVQGMVQQYAESIQAGDWTSVSLGLENSPVGAAVTAFNDFLADVDAGIEGLTGFGNIDVDEGTPADPGQPQDTTTNNQDGNNEDDPNSDDDEEDEGSGDDEEEEEEPEEEQAPEDEAGEDEAPAEESEEGSGTPNPMGDGGNDPDAAPAGYALDPEDTVQVVSAKAQLLGESDLAFKGGAVDPADSDDPEGGGFVTFAGTTEPDDDFGKGIQLDGDVNMTLATGGGATTPTEGEEEPIMDLSPIAEEALPDYGVTDPPEMAMSAEVSSELAAESVTAADVAADTEDVAETVD